MGGLAVIINNLDEEQIPTKKDVEAMGQVLKAIGFDVQIHKNLTSQQMNSVKRSFTEQRIHSDSNCFLVLVISHGTADNFLQDRDGNRTWNIESLITEVSDISVENKHLLQHWPGCLHVTEHAKDAIVNTHFFLSPCISFHSLP